MRPYVAELADCPLHEVQDKLVTFRLVLIYYSGQKNWLQKYFTKNIESIWASSFKIWAKIEIQEQIHNKNPVTSWECFERHIFNTDLLSAKLQHRTQVLTARTVRFISAPLIMTLRKIDKHNTSCHRHHLVQCIPLTNKGRYSSRSPVTTGIYNTGIAQQCL